MGQVAFDALQASEELETAGISREQARAISLVVRKSHEVADLATKVDLAEVKRDIADVCKDLSVEIINIHKDLSAEIADIRKDIQTRFEKNEAQMHAHSEQMDKRLDFSEKRFDRLEMKFDRLQWFLVAAALSFLFKEMIIRLFGY